jgi:uncharacterized protein YodC (DUF2158 family)
MRRRAAPAIKPTKQASIEMDFKPGDIVQLKSGGRAMTVVTQTKAEVNVIWYAENDDSIRTSSIPTIALSLIELDDDEDFEDE